MVQLSECNAVGQSLVTVRALCCILKAEPWMAERANWRMDAPLSEKEYKRVPER